jgi:hypothetical protein
MRSSNNNNKNQQSTKRNKDKHCSVDNNECQDSKEKEQQQESGKTTTITITKIGNTSRDILDIIETFDVASWNKGIQIKGNAPDIIKRSQERGEGMEGIDQGNITPASTNVLRQTALRIYYRSS